MTTEALKACTLKKLAEMAKKRGVSGWHGMKKDQLVRALGRIQAKNSTRAKASSSSRTKSATRTKAASRGKTAKKAALPARLSTNSRISTNGKLHLAAKSSSSRKAAAAAKRPASKPAASKPSADKSDSARAPMLLKVLPPKNVPTAKPSKAQLKIAQIKTKQERLKNLASCTPPGRPEGYAKDRLIAMVRGPYWLHAYWELSRQGVRRAEAAMGQDWHSAKPTLRVLEISGNGTTSTGERVIRDIDIHGDVNNWYVDVEDPPKNYRLDIGYLAANGRFYLLARSNVVSTPRSAASDAEDENWSEVVEDFDKIYAMSGGYASNGTSSDLQEVFEERLRRPMGSPMTTKFGAGANGVVSRRRSFSFDLDAELIVFGTTEPDAHVTLQGEPVKVQADGTFSVRYSMPNCRQVIPAVACSVDGVEQRTVILAVERNTKAMEPLVRESNE
ncbi:MAG: DUF4912 domain-containing protein [Pirellulales bacterium]